MLTAGSFEPAQRFEDFVALALSLGVLGGRDGIDVQAGSAILGDTVTGHWVSLLSRTHFGFETARHSFALGKPAVCA